MFAALARLMQRRRVPALLLALAVAAVTAVLIGDLQSRLTNSLSDYDDPGKPNVAARELIHRATGIDPQQGYALLVRSDRPIDPAAPPPEVTGALALLRSRPEVRDVVPLTVPGLVSSDKRSVLIIGEVGSMTDAATRTAEADMQRAIGADDALRGRVWLGGATPAHVQLGEISTDDLGASESLALPILLILLILVFRGLVAALLPLVGGLFSVLLTLFGMRVLTEFMHMSDGGLSLATALGLGLSIDFGLLLVNRYREEMAVSGPGLAALSGTYRTAGRTVLFSAITVAAALSVLLVFPQPYLRSLALSGVLTVVSAALYALLVLPALLALLGHRVDALSPRRWRRASAEPPLRWRRLARVVMGRPVVFAVLATAVLLVLISPARDARFSGVDPADMPRDVSSGVVAAAVAHDFPDAPADPVRIVFSAPASSASTYAPYVSRLAAVPGVRAVAPAAPLGDAHVLIDAVIDDPLGPGGRAVLERIEAVPAPGPALFAGSTADLRSQSDTIREHLPLAGLLLAVITFLLLFAFTGSVLLPVKALIMNALSVGAAFGVLVWVFQGGRYGFGPVSELEQTSPIVLCALAFGLATDYNLFLLGRIKEARELTGDDRAAVEEGLARTASMITSAAALFCVAVGALMLSRITLIQQLGMGTMVAVILDATIVRALLVPSLMVLLGRANWWAPGFLRALHARLGLSRLEEPARPILVQPVPVGDQA
ncbi:MMPL family transporter [Microbispora sp. NPDC049125]|uniref:MMPL family transporter n=1 Tax=Microbispora sp. NPDC049125 TaxID=3154929 RepID=UPI003467ECA0